VRVVLASSLGGAGHLQPLVSVGSCLRAAGHDVSLLVPPSLEYGARASSLAYNVGLEPPREVVDEYRDRLALGPAEAVAGLLDRELFAAHCTAAMLPVAESLVTAERPDFVLREPCEYASAVAAVRAAIPFGTVAISQAQLEHDVLSMVSPIVDRFHAGTSNAIAASPLLSSFPESLDPSPWTTTVRYGIEDEPPTPLPDWWHGANGPLVYVTFGSVVGHMPIAGRVFRCALDAVEHLDARVLLTMGRSGAVDGLGAVPSNVHVERWVPQSSVLAACDLVVCHGGSGTTFGALRAGVPLVVCPLYADNSRNGSAVERIGAGIVAPDDGATNVSGLATWALIIRRSIEHVLATPSFALAAGAVGREMSGYPTADVALSQCVPRCVSDASSRRASHAALLAPSEPRPVDASLTAQNIERDAS
jgi:UDP:flavonoid glycosyltransferase YjiC (YdhE family)